MKTCLCMPKALTHTSCGYCSTHHWTWCMNVWLPVRTQRSLSQFFCVSTLIQSVFRHIASVYIQLWCCKITWPLCDPETALAGGRYSVSCSRTVIHFQADFIFQYNWRSEHLSGYFKNSWKSSSSRLKPLRAHKTSWCVDVAPVSQCTANTAFQILNNFMDVCIPFNMTERWFISESRDVEDILIVSAFQKT